MKFSKTKDWGISGIAFDVAQQPESAKLFFGSSDFKVYEFDTATEKPTPVAFTGGGHTSYVTAVVSSGENLVSGGYDGHLIWWNRKDRKQIRSQKAHAKWIRNIAVLPDGTHVASVSDDMTCKLWDANSGDLLHVFADHNPSTPNNYPSMLYAVAFSADGKLLATADKTGHIIVRETATKKSLAELDAPKMYTWDPRARRHSIGGIRSLAFSADGTKIAAGGIGKIGNIDHLGGPSRVEVFDWKANKRLHEIEDDKYKGLVERLEFHADGKTLFGAGGDHGGFVTLYDMNSGKIAHQEKAPMHVHGHAIDSDWKTLYTVGHGRIAQWAIEA